MNEHEHGFLNFVAEDDRRRLSTLLGLGPKRRKDVRAMLDHKVALDPRWVSILSGKEHNPDAVIRRLRLLGAPDTCWMLAAHSDLDGRHAPLQEGVMSLLRSMSGGFISCLPGRLGYFQYEPPGVAYVMNRRI